MLYLLPNLLSADADPEATFVPQVAKVTLTLQGLIAESHKVGRQFLHRFGKSELPHLLLNEHTQPNELEALLAPIKRGERWGLISDAGLPCLADPGAALVLRARQEQVSVQALPGPSSIPLALMLSGLPAQSFTFHGYLERDSARLQQQLLSLQKQKTTHLFIEAPYRNDKLLQTLIRTLHPEKLLCIASNLTSPSQLLMTHPIRQWKQLTLPPLPNPTLFLFY
jgi:16S rRNA (cytidine1402-2'-O)-methyltransferase